MIYNISNQGPVPGAVPAGGEEVRGEREADGGRGGVSEVINEFNYK